MKMDFGYTVVDGDGDRDSSVLSLTITDSSEVVAVDDFVVVSPDAAVSYDAITHTISIPGSVNVAQLVDDFEVDPGSFGHDDWVGFAENFSGTFRTSGPVTVVFDLHVQGFTSGDLGRVYLQKNNGFIWENISNIPVDVNSVNDRDFKIDEPGEYRLYGSGLDLTLQGNFKFSVINIEGETIIPAQTLTVNQDFVDVDWAAAALIAGNVVTKDSPGSEGALVVDVDGTPVVNAGTVIHGDYGDLTIHPDGSYSYDPNYAPEDADYVGGTLTDSFTYKLEQPDGDFDTAVLTFDVTPHLPSGAIVADSTSHLASGTDRADFIFGTDGNDTLDGSAGNDYLNGGAGDDYISGGTGNDHLVGADGNDTLVGGAGDDLMTGGAGSDVFKYVDGDLADGVHGDTITDFRLGDGGDSLDLSALLHGATNSDLDNFLDFEVSNIDSGAGTATVEIQVSQNGDGHFTSLATIDVSGATGMGDVAIETMLKAQIDI